MPVSIKHLRQLRSMPNTSMTLFALWEDDKLFYQVDLVKLDERNFKATVRFDDKSEHKLKTSHLHIQFSASDFPYSSEDEIVCCMCEGGDSEEPNNLVLCDICQQGYHQDCHYPKLTEKDIKSDEWSCNTCERILRQARPKINTSTPKAGITKANKMKVAVKPIRPAKRLQTEIVEQDEAIDAVATAIVRTEDLVNCIAERKVNKKKNAQPA